MTRLIAAAALLFAAVAAQAEPAVVASGAYPEGLLEHNGRLFFTEMGADRVSIIAPGGTQSFWTERGCGPTSIAPFGPSGYLVNCHLGRAVVEISDKGVTGRRFRAANGVPIQDPNASISDGAGGVFFSDSGIFDLGAPPTGRVYHITAMGTLSEVVSGLRYANGVNFDPATHTLYVSEHLARRVLALTLDDRFRPTARRVLIDFATQSATRDKSYPLAGPDGIALRPGLLVIAEYGEGRVHIFTRDGGYRTTLKVAMPFVDTVLWDAAGSLLAGGSFQNTRMPYEGAVVRFDAAEWDRPR